MFTNLKSLKRVTLRDLQIDSEGYGHEKELFDASELRSITKRDPKQWKMLTDKIFFTDMKNDMQNEIFKI